MSLLLIYSIYSHLLASGIYLHIFLRKSKSMNVVLVCPKIQNKITFKYGGESVKHTMIYCPDDVRAQKSTLLSDSIIFYACSLFLFYC